MKCVLWDFDGTLAHRPQQWSGAVLDVLRDAGVDRGASVEDVRPFLRTGFPWHEPHVVRPPGQHADDWWAALNPVFARAIQQLGGIDEKEAFDLAARVRLVYTDARSWTLYEDTRPALEALAARGWVQGLLSNHVPELRAIVHALGVAEFFADICNSAETGAEKPNAAAFQLALDRLPNAARVWMVGDSLSADVLGAEAVGIPAVLVRGFHASSQHCCNALTEVPAIIDAE